jgi:hypothetical protein
MKTASWIIVEKATGKAVFETFKKATADAINREKFDVLTALEYLQQLNAKLKEVTA